MKNQKTLLKILLLSALFASMMAGCSSSAITLYQPPQYQVEGRVADTLARYSPEHEALVRIEEQKKKKRRLDIIAYGIIVLAIVLTKIIQ